MASFVTRKSGSRFVTFVDARRRRHTITLGRVHDRDMPALRAKIEDLIAASLFHRTIEESTARWLAKQPNRMLDKLAQAGLIEPRRHITIGEWLEQYLAEKRADVKPESMRKFEQTRAKLLAHFGPDRPMAAITFEDAAKWRLRLKEEDLSEATIKTHAGNAKQVFREALRRKLIEENPMELLRSGSTARENERYVTPDEIARVLDCCRDSEWRLLFGLARYAGLRVPSEPHLVTWADVDFERARLMVRSPKTERHAGHERRVVPVVPELMALLHARFAEVEEGEAALVTLRLSGAFRRNVGRLLRRAKVEPWPSLWQTLRDSRERQWLMEGVAQFACSCWLGHSISVSGKHYANRVPDELYAKVAGLDGGGATSSAQRQAQRAAQQNLHEPSRTEPKGEGGEFAGSAVTSGECDTLRDPSTQCELSAKGERGDSNPRPPGPQPGALTN